MDEDQWVACNDSETMFKFLKGSGFASERKARLWGCAFVRRVWHLVSDERLREAVRVTERHADGQATRDELAAAVRLARSLYKDYGQAGRAAYYASWYSAGSSFERARYAAWYAGWAAARAAGRDAQSAAAKECLVAERATQSNLLRDVVGNPFHPLLPLAPSLLKWNAEAVPKLAHAVYEERDLPGGHLGAARLAVLADMLEEAGCSDADVLGHLRGPGPHVRGCWVLDRLLGKE